VSYARRPMQRPLPVFDKNVQEQQYVVVTAAAAENNYWPSRSVAVHAAEAWRLLVRAERCGLHASIVPYAPKRPSILERLGFSGGHRA
jgi:hypothetical protein